MTALSDAASMGGYMPNGAFTFTDEGDSWDQNNCTSPVNINLDEGIHRRAAASRIDDPSLVIGGLYNGLTDYDSRLNMLKGDIALIDSDDFRHEYESGGAAFDGRPYVLSSLLGYTLPIPHTESSWRRSKRAVGFIALDSLLENARTGNAPNYGNTVYCSGSIGGNNLYQVVPGKISAGTLMQFDIGPLNPSSREKWRASQMRPKNRWTADAHKPILTPFNPNGGAQILIDGFEKWIQDTGAGSPPGAQNVIANPASAKVDARTIDEDSQVGANMARSVLGAMWMGVVLAVRAGVVTPAQDAKSPQNLADLFKFNDFDRTFAARFAERLGLTGNDATDRVLRTALVGSFWQSYTDEQDVADAFSMESALNDRTAAREIQEVSSVRLVRTITGAYYENQANVLFKTTNNTVQGMKLRGVIMH